MVKKLSTVPGILKPDIRNIITATNMPLIHDGTIGVGAAPGAIVTQQFQIATQRGRVKWLDIYPFFNSTAALEEDTKITVSAGGQILVKNAQVSEYAFNSEMHSKRNRRIRVNLNDAQTFEITINNSGSALIQAAFVQLYYTSDAHDYFVENIFKFNTSLGLKRESFRIVLPNSTADATALTEVRLPRNSGDIYGYSVTCPSDESALRNVFYELSFNDLIVVNRAFGLTASTNNPRKQFAEPLFIETGSTMRFSALADLSVIATDVPLTVTLFYGN